MSLDVYLKAERVLPSASGPRILIRENGATRTVSRGEWDRRFPGQEPVTFQDDQTDNTVFSANITHNLTRMAEAAGIYSHIWRPDELNFTKARDLIEPLTDGLERLRKSPETYKAFNPENGWGSYDGFVDFVGEYLLACMAYPSAEVGVWR